MEGSISDGWMMKFWQLFLYQHFPEAREGNSFLLAKVCINHQSLVADCILIHALTLAILDSQGCLQIFIPSSSAPVKMAAQHHSFFSTSQQNLWASRGRVDVERQGSWHRELEYLSCFLERATGQILPPMQLLWEGHKGLRPTAGTCTRALVPARKIHSARSLMESQGHSSRVTDHCLQNEYSMVSSELQPCKTLFRFWLIGLLIGKRMAAPSKL